MSEEPKTFSQEDVDNIIKERLGRERAKQEDQQEEMSNLTNQFEELKKQNPAFLLYCQACIPVLPTGFHRLALLLCLHF